MVSTEKTYIMFYQKKPRVDAIPQSQQYSTPMRPSQQRKSTRQINKTEKEKAREEEKASKEERRKMEEERKLKESENLNNKGNVKPPSTEDCTNTKKDEEDGKQYCICKRTYDKNNHECMIGCDKCEEWYHCKCIDFVCVECAGNDGDEVIRLKKELKQKTEQAKIEAEDANISGKRACKHEATCQNSRERKCQASKSTS